MAVERDATPRPRPRVLLYILRQDVRLADNPIFHAVSTQSSLDPDRKVKQQRDTDSKPRNDSPLSHEHIPYFTHLLPVYIFPANQVEVSGFIANPADRSPYPQSRSQIAGLWRTGPHRARFMAQGVWDLKQRLENLQCGSGLEIRVGLIEEAVEDILGWYAGGEEDASSCGADVVGIWMTSHEGTEERTTEARVKRIAERNNIDFRLWDDEKYYIDDQDLPFHDISDLPNVYTTFRKSVEPLRSRPRRTIPAPTQLPPLPPEVPPQRHPFQIPSNLDSLIQALLSPLEDELTNGPDHPPQWPDNVDSAHPFGGGETEAQNRLNHLVSQGAISSYKATRNGMLGEDFSTKLSAFLAQGHQTARQIHWAMVDFEEGRGPGRGASGYGKGENEGTAAIRFELLWRDYMRLYARKFGCRMYRLYGVHNTWNSSRWGGDGNDGQKGRKRFKLLDQSGGAGDNPERTKEAFARFRAGRTGIGLIDASNRELILTGYTSNRARQNVASFLSSHLGIDWRVGAEWYEYLLTDYDMANNWGNWQYVAGVGNDPRQGRIFNPVKQALDYDKKGEYIRAWVPELRGVDLKKDYGAGNEEIDQGKLMGLYQAWRLPEGEKQKLGLKGLDWVEHPLTRIQFSVGRGKGAQGSEARGRGRGRRGGSRGREKGFRRLGSDERSERMGIGADG
ncbi:cryptochrome [Periconia macrospinosa]|uniref:Cryptochrome DASH n=1 Tax=Periconia macrospinosa TaxID=97972 RepID=A0A2V1EBN8_9PLEO|nr:cryptochrome [Periconia macrospinosa]